MTPEKLTAMHAALMSECQLSHIDALQKVLDYLADWKTACKAHEAGDFKLAEKVGRKLLAMPNFPEFHRIEFLILLGFVVDDHSEAISFRNHAECLWREHVKDYLPGKEEGLDDIRETLDDLAQELEHEREDIEEDDMVEVEVEAEGAPDNSTTEHSFTTTHEETKENVVPMDDIKDDLSNALHDKTTNIQVEPEFFGMRYNPYMVSRGIQVAPAITIESFENGFAYVAL